MKFNFTFLLIVLLCFTLSVSCQEATTTNTESETIEKVMLDDSIAFALEMATEVDVGQLQLTNVEFMYVAINRSIDAETIYNIQLKNDIRNLNLKETALRMTHLNKSFDKKGIGLTETLNKVC